VKRIPPEFGDLHIPKHSRRLLGHSMLGGRLYGTSPGCSCGWGYRSNQNKAEAVIAHRQHVREAFEASQNDP
jgi:hypothetical protein